MPADTEIVVKTYETSKSYADGLTRMIASGWTSKSVVEKRKPQGCLTIWGRRTELIVTYERAVSHMPKGEATLQAGYCPNCGFAVAPTAFFCPRCSTNLKQ